MVSGEPPKRINIFFQKGANSLSILVQQTPICFKQSEEVFTEKSKGTYSPQIAFKAILN